LENKVDFNSAVNVIQKIDLIHAELTRLTNLRNDNILTNEYFEYILQIHNLCFEIEHYQGFLDSAVLLVDFYISINDHYALLEVIEKIYDYISLIPEVEKFAWMINELSIKFYMDGMYEKAFTNCLLLYNFAKEYEIERYIVLSYVNRGDIFRLIGSHFEAQEFFLKAIKKYEKAGPDSTSSYLIALENMCESIVENYDNEHKDPLPYFNRIEILIRDFKSFDYTYYVGIRAKYYYKLGDYENATIWFEKCLRLYKDVDSEYDFYKYEKAIEFAKMHYEEKNYCDAKKALEKYDIENLEKDYIRIQMEYLKLSAHLAEKQSDLISAVKYFNEYINLQDDESSKNKSCHSRIERIIKEDEYRQSVKLLRKENLSDHLTKLFNRKKLLQDLKDMLESKDEGVNYVIVMVDLDNFKLINDINGHVAGDKCLQAVGRCLKDICQKYPGSAYRYGGDEFITIHKHNNNMKIQKLGESIRNCIKKLGFYSEKDNIKTFVTSSVGVYGFTANSDLRARDVIKSVDELMYKVKNNRKDAVSVENTISQ